MIRLVAAIVTVLIIGVMLLPRQAYAVESVQVSGILGSKAVLQVEGKQRIVAIGKSSPEGVKVLAIEGEEVLLEIAGEEQRLTLGDAPIGTAFAQPDKIVERVYKSNRMYRTTGTINGRTVDFLVDTGATTVAMNANEAKRLGINFLLDGQKTYVNTASGKAKAFYLKLNTVSVGRIKLSNIDAVVIDGDSPSVVLLGMSFLGRLDIQHKGEVMILETKY